jgi:LacI family transcriptional regulator
MAGAALQHAPTASPTPAPRPRRLSNSLWKRLQSRHAVGRIDVTVTIKDVAREANVSVATVSRALNGHENVASAVRERVLQVATRLRYSPHHAARSLSSRRTRTIGVVLPDLHGGFFSELMRGIDQVARAHGLHLLVSSCHGNPADQRVALLAMRGRVDGLLVMSPFADDPGLFSHDLTSGTPVVLMNSAPGGDTPVPAVRIDSHGGARAMTSYLVACGYRRIAFISGPADNFDARERERGYREVLGEQLPETAARVVAGDFGEVSGHEAGVALLAAGELPDAVFAANDMMAIGCLYALNRGGLQVPGGIGLAGFDDIPLARYVHPALTTMRVDIAELGGRALRRLLARAAPDAGADALADVADVVLSPRLVARDSTVAPRVHVTQHNAS